MAEFPDLGAHCYFPSCRKNDFLPFACSDCKKSFCLDHRTKESHQCAIKDKMEQDALFCPLCKVSVRILPKQDRNDVLNEHIEMGCKLSEAAQKRKEAREKGRCSLPSCHKSELIPTICKQCKKQFCIKHRLEVDHECKQPQTRPSTCVCF